MPLRSRSQRRRLSPPRRPRPDRSSAPRTTDGRAGERTPRRWSRSTDPGLGVQPADVEQPHLALGHELGQVAPTLGIVQRRAPRRAACSAPSRRAGAGGGIREPSTRTTSESGSTRIPCSVTSRPFTSTRPSLISCSAARRDATPAAASTFCRRTPSQPLSLLSLLDRPFDRLRARFDRLRARRAHGQLSSAPPRAPRPRAGAGPAAAAPRALSSPIRSRKCPVVANVTAPGVDVVSGLGDQPAGEQRADHAVHVDPADGRDAAPGDRLGVGDDRQRLQRRLRQLGLGVLEQRRC